MRFSEPRHPECTTANAPGAAKITGTGLDEAGISRYAVVQSEIRPGELEQIFIITHFER